MAAAGFVVNADAIKAYGSVVAGQESTLSQVHSALAGIHLPSNAFGLLPEADELYQAYTQHAREALEITAKLPTQITEVALGLDATAVTYTELEKELAGAIRHIGGGGGSGLDVYTGGSGQSVSSMESESAAAYQWTSKPVTQLPPARAPENGAKGIEGLMEEAVNWVINHVPELPKLLNDVTGDTGALIAAANVWSQQGNNLNNVIRALSDNATHLPQEWAGDASASFGKFMAEVIQGLNDLVTVMSQTQKILEDAAKEAATAHDIIVEIITEVVEWVIGNILVDALTLGIATAVEAPATAAYLALKAEQAAQVSAKLGKVFEELIRILDAMKELKAGVTGAEGLGKLAQFSKISGHLANKVLHDGSYLNAAKAIKGGRVIETGVQVGVVQGLAHIATGGMGVKGGLISAGTKIGMGIAKGPAGDLLHGDPGKAWDDIKQDGAAVGIGSPRTPQAPTSARIDAELNGQTPPPPPPPAHAGPAPTPSPGPAPQATSSTNILGDSVPVSDSGPAS